MTTVYNNLSYNLTKQLDDSKVLSRLANSFEAYVRTQKDLIKEKRLSNLLKMAELKDKLDGRQWNELQQAIRDDIMLGGSND